MLTPKEQVEAGLNTIKYLTGVSQADFDTLKTVAAETHDWGGAVATAFYDTLFAHNRTAAVFHEGERPIREESLIGWYHSLFNVDDEDKFWRDQIIIGFHHIRRHTNNEYMIGMAHKVRLIFRDNIVKTLGCERGLEVSTAFDRIMDTVVGLTAEIYDVMSQVAFSESTGTNLALMDALIQESVDGVQQEVLG